MVLPIFSFIVLENNIRQKYFLHYNSITHTFNIEMVCKTKIKKTQLKTNKRENQSNKMFKNQFKKEQEEV